MNAKTWLRHYGKPGCRYAVIRNRLALKYFAGVRQGESFKEPDFGRSGPGRTRRELLAAYEADYAHVKLYYPFPTADSIEAVYTDECLPGLSELTQNAPSDGVRLQLFDEPAAWQTLLAEGLFPEFCDSFIVEYSDKVPKGREELLYQKLPTNRGPAFALSTMILKEPSGEKFVRKVAPAQEALSHLREIWGNHVRLKRLYEGFDLFINPCKIIEKDGDLVGEFAFEEGRTLTSFLDERITAQDEKGFYSLVDEMIRRISEPGLDDDGCLEFCSLDLIFDNFIIDTDAWTMIDYEWAQERPPVRFLLYRALRQYFLDDHLRGTDTAALFSGALSHYGIGPEEAAAFDLREEEFQNQVRQGTQPQASCKAIGFSRLAAMLPDRGEEMDVECYADLGGGFLPENRIPAVSEGPEGSSKDEESPTQRQVRIALPDGTVGVRFDPAELPGVLELLMVTDEDGKRIRPGRSNAAKRRGLSYLFLTPDPQIRFRPGRGSRRLTIVYRFTPLSPEAAERMGAVLFKERRGRGAAGTER